MEIEDDPDMLLGDGSEETVPQDLRTSHPVFDIQFHPSSPFLAVGMINGSVDVHEFRVNETRHVASFPGLHSSAIRAMEFSEDGQYLVTVGTDRHLQVLDAHKQQTVLRINEAKPNPHKHGLSALNICSETLVATGDDDGMICFWDLRTGKPEAKYHEHGDYIGQMLFFSEVNQLVSCSGDTTLGCYDLRRRAIVDYSEKRKDELSSMCFIPATDDIICGTSTGKLPIWRYGSWERPFDLHDRHPKECDALLTYNDNLFFTGACDGVVRVLQHHPTRRILCHLGGNDKRRFPINHITISHDRNFLAVSGDEPFVQFLDIKFMADDTELDKLRSRAEARHLATIREANMAKAKEGEEDDSDWEDTSDDDDSSWTDSSDSDDDNDREDDIPDDEDDRDARANLKRSARASSAVAVDDDEDEDEEHLTRKQKRERVAAAKWLKEEQKKKVNFKGERKRRRARGFWGDL